MWRRPQNNPAVPVPTYYPDDGADSHLHSPRRKSYVGRVTGSSAMPMSSISNTLTSHTAAALGHTAFAQNLASIQKNPGNSSSSSMDPFSEAAYHEWVSSMGLQQHQQQNTTEPQAIWPNTMGRNSSKQIGDDGSMPKLPDYLSPIIFGQANGSDPMSLEEDSTMESLKVPANTPTTFPDNSTGASVLSGLWQGSSQCLADRPLYSGQFDYNIPNPAISGELANSLTHSLLNQPYPLGASQNALPHQIPLPASEVRSRKENRHLNNASSVHSPSSNPSPSLEAQIRKFSQTSNAFGVIGNDRDSSGSGLTYSRRTSTGEFGTNITNHATPNQTYVRVAASGSGPGSGSEKGIKRSRNFTPASAKAIDEEDEPRRLSPRMRTVTAVDADTEAQTETAE